MFYRVAKYGISVFAAGFAFGTLREVVLAPLVGGRVAALIEFPMMLIAVGVLAWLVYRHDATKTSIGRRVLEGTVAAFVLVGFESTLALTILDQPLVDYFKSYDVSEGALFPFGLLFMALAPGLLGRPQGNPVR